MLSPPPFQHCGGERPCCPRGSDAFRFVVFVVGVAGVFWTGYFSRGLYPGNLVMYV